MLLERLYDEDLAQASYVIGCQATGEALVVDPRRDITPYLELTARHDLRVVAVTETHIHADYLSGTRELAAATGATAHVSGEGGPDWQYGFEAQRLHDGDEITIGNIRVQARHTPGHTPEHLMFLVTDGATADSPGYALTGDFVFIGDLGRPDLLDEAAGGVDTRFEGAKQLFRSLREVFWSLPDHVMVYPAHGAGSACGKALGALPASTVGYERRFSWWAPYVEKNDEQGFVDSLLDGQPDAHAYFARMKVDNREGPQVVGELPALRRFEAAELAPMIEADEAIVVDPRAHTAVHEGTVQGALNIPGPAKAASFGAWACDPQRETRPLVVLTGDPEAAQQMRNHLLRVGIDRVIGYVDSLEGLPTAVPAVISPAELEDTERALLLDVRSRSEHADGHIPGSLQLSAGKALWNLERLPREGTVITYCQSGVRNSVVASALRREGIDVVELDGSYAGWSTWAEQPQFNV
ncbi:MBL fold metallo-hydrolase [Brachybacterium sp. p3-SID1565]|uniref:MBL fold metallo-hydrolase n=1 Tax=Brachybacterium sp. p3-SID1565 TaxID=2916046 RepID=UPI0021A7ADDA|nr:MBL fold metallo-hydrolase [Brachybacterium sp. p3-SID1565]MCT1384226.1 MBL fold metallo-hydrolase [Brachybacterium sp. p3-SID1565]